MATAEPPTVGDSIDLLAALSAAIAVIFLYLGSMFAASNKFVMTAMLASALSTGLFAYHIQTTHGGRS